MSGGHYTLVSSETPLGQAAKEIAKRIAKAVWEDGTSLEAAITGMALHLAIAANTVAKDDPRAFLNQIHRLANTILDQNDGMTKQ